MEIKCNGVDVVISMCHVLEHFEGLKGRTCIATCNSFEEVNAILNDPLNQPGYLWQWEIDFQDKE